MVFQFLEICSENEVFIRHFPKIANQALSFWEIMKAKEDTF